MASPSSGPFSQLPLRSSNEVHFVRAFSTYLTHDPLLRGPNLLQIIRQDFSIASFTDSDILTHNYELYRRVIRVLPDLEIPIPPSVDGSNNILVRLLHRIWPNDDYSSHRADAYNRYLGIRRASRQNALPSGRSPHTVPPMSTPTSNDRAPITPHPPTPHPGFEVPRLPFHPKMTMAPPQPHLVPIPTPLPFTFLQ